MSFLFKVVNNVVVPNTETLLISPFKEIWENDKTEDKENAMRDFAFIEFMTSKKKSNGFSGYEEEERRRILSQRFYKSEKHKISAEVEEGMSIIVDMQTKGSPTYSFYMSLLKGVEEMKNFFNNVDLDERDDKNKPIYNISMITRAIGDFDKVLQSLMSAREKLDHEVYEITKSKGNKEINHYEM